MALSIEERNTRFWTITISAESSVKKDAIAKKSKMYMFEDKAMAEKVITDNNQFPKATE